MPVIDYARFWSTAFDSIEDLVFLMDKDFTLLKVNKSFIRFTGREEKDMVGRKCREVIFAAENVLPGCAPEGVAALSEKKEIYEPNFKKWLCVTTTPIFDGANTIVGFICLSSDITRLRQAEEALKKNKEKLEIQVWGLEKTKSNFMLLYNGLENKKAELQQSIDRLKRILLESVDALASAAEKRDPYTAGHQQRVASLACEIAKELGFSEEQIEGVKIAGVLHDIGKIYVPDALLTKIGKLTDQEFGEIKKHAQFGYDILKKIEFLWPVAQIVLQHHERLNGSGYPQKLSGEEIILEARIVGVADVVEAMASPRPYRAALGIDTALNEIMRHKDTLYDPEVVDVCYRLFREKGYRLTGGENN